MGKKQKDSNLGRSLMKDKSKRHNKFKGSLRHTSELQDGSDYNRINFQSITEQSDVDSFLTTAELAGIDFTAEKLNVNFVRPSTLQGILTSEERDKIKSIQDDNIDLLRIPRRPPWDRSMSAEELAEAEKESFLKWRRSLIELEQRDGIVLTPYEKNIEFWRQLWRVIERSDVVVQIVDARNPLLFRCEDLSKYVKEVSCHKENLLLVNKSDFLTELQREKWSNYFKKVGIQAVFFSATIEDAAESEATDARESSTIDEEDNLSNLNLSDEQDESDESFNFASSVQECQKDIEHFTDASEHFIDENYNFPAGEEEPNRGATEFSPPNYINSSKLLSRVELMEVFKNFHSGMKVNPSHVTIGLVGYPNVGKSSTINSLLQVKKVSVSATPGKTKHFQTLYLSDDLLLCDCPGLVFPAFVCTKEEMIISGILSIDQMRDHVPPMNLVLSLIPRFVLEAKYGVHIPLPLEGEDPNRSPISEEFLAVYGYNRGFMTPRGIPDHPKCARLILKDYVTGGLLYSHCPPGESQEEYHKFLIDKFRKPNAQSTAQQLSCLSRRKDGKTVDANFFNASSSNVHIQGRKTLKMVPCNSLTPDEASDETALRPKKHVPMRNVKQKARKKFAHLDQ